MTTPLTKGRRSPFTPCSHRGYGTHCHRCAQAVEIQARAEELSRCASPEAIAKLAYAQVDADAILVRAGGHRFSSNVKNPKGLVAGMLTESKRLRALPTFEQIMKKLEHGF